MDGSDIAFPSVQQTYMYMVQPIYVQVGCLSRVCTWMEGGEWRVTY